MKSSWFKIWNLKCAYMSNNEVSLKTVIEQKIWERKRVNDLYCFQLYLLKYSFTQNEKKSVNESWAQSL